LSTNVYDIDAALLANIEDLQSSLDRAKEKLQENSLTLSENDKEIAKLNTDVETVSGCAVLAESDAILSVYKFCFPIEGS